MRMPIMDKFSSPAKSEKKLSSVPNYPSICMHSGCEEETDIAFAVVRNEIGRKLTGTLSDFGYRDHNGFQLKKDFSFVRWITRCSKCHYVDLATTNKIYFKNKWIDRLGKGEVRDGSVTKEQAANYIDEVTE